MSSAKHCRHRKEDGTPCGSPVLRGQGYCYFHLRYKRYPLRTWRNKHRIGGWHFRPNIANNLRAVEAALKRVDGALSGDCVDPERARLIRWGLQTMASELRRAEYERYLESVKRGEADVIQRPTAEPLTHSDSIFYDKPFGINYPERNPSQGIDSKEAQGVGVHEAESALRSTSASKPGVAKPAQKTGATMKSRGLHCDLSGDR